MWADKQSRWACRAGSLRQGKADTVGSAGQAAWKTMQAGIARQKGKVGGRVGKVDKADGFSRCTHWEERKVEKLRRTGKKATGGRKRHGLCSQGWASTAGR